MKKVIIIILVSLNCFAFAQTDSKTVVAKSTTSTKTPKVFLIGNIGGGVLIGTQKVNNQAEKDLVNTLRKGLVFDLGLYFKLNNGNALGFKFNRFGSSGTIKRSVYNSSGDLVTITGDEKISLNFYSLSYLLNFNKSNSPHDFSMELAAGYFAYVDEFVISATINGSKATLPSDLTYGNQNGGAFGFLGGLGYKYRVSDKFSVGPNINFLIGTVSEVEQKYPGSPKRNVNLPTEDYISLARIDFSVGAIFKL